MPWKYLIRTKVVHSGCNLALAGCGYRRAKIGRKGMTVPLRQAGIMLKITLVRNYIWEGSCYKSAYVGN
jgi:hypothetical protein